MPRFHHLALATRDFDQTLSFYTTALGARERLRFSQDGLRVALVEFDDGVMMEVLETSPAASAARTAVAAAASKLPGGDQISGVSPLLHFALEVDDVDAAFQSAIDAGATPAEPPADNTIHDDTGRGERTIRFAFVTGPNGESIEFISGRL